MVFGLGVKEKKKEIKHKRNWLYSQNPILEINKFNIKCYIYQIFILFGTNREFMYIVYVSVFGNSKWNLKDIACRLKINW